MFQRLVVLGSQLPSLAFFVICSAGCASHAFAQLDPGFGVGGGAVAGFPPVHARASRAASVVDGADAVFVAGLGVVRNDQNFLDANAVLVAKFTPAGVPDVAYGTNGKVLVPIAQNDETMLLAALDSAERLVVLVRDHPAGGGYRLRLFRFLANGTSDPDFGVGGAVEVANPFPALLLSKGAPYPLSMAIDGNNRVVVVTNFRSGLPSFGFDVLVSRLSAAGQVDPAYGDNGFRVLAFGVQNYDQATGLVLSADGSVHVAMVSGPTLGGAPVYLDLLVVKLDGAGTLDPAFGAGGILALPSGTGRSLTSRNLVRDPDGRLLVLVHRLDGTVDPVVTTDFIVRVDATGALDLSFGNDGMLPLPATNTPRFFEFSDIRLDTAGNFVVRFIEWPSPETQGFGIIRVSPEGEPDQGFGTGGVWVQPRDGHLYENWVSSMDGQQRLVVTGTIDAIPDDWDFGVVRLLLPPFARIDLASSSAFANAGDTLTFAATPNLDGLTGKIAFRADGQPIAGCESKALVAGVATCVASLPVGAHAIVARYVDDARYPDLHSPTVFQYIKPQGLVADIDGDGLTTAATDGALLVRYLLGWRDAGLVEGGLAANAPRSDPATIALYVEGLGAFFDIDGDGRVDALTDGILLLRYLAGQRGAALVNGAIGAKAQRKSALDVENFLEQLTH